MNTERKKFRIPHTYAILAVIMLFAFFLTFILPSGAYETIINEATGKLVIDPQSFHNVDKIYLNLFDLFLSVPTAMEKAAYIIFFIFIICGSFQVINSTGTIEVAICSLAQKMKGKELLTIPIFVFVFSIGGATFGLSEETIIFVPMGIILARSLGYDAMTGFAMISLGAHVGFNSAWLNPFTVGVAQGVAELPLFSGIEMRLIIWVTYLIVTSFYIMRYAKKVKNDRTLSVVYDLEITEQGSSLDLDSLPKLNIRQKIILVLIAATIVLLVYGISKMGWYISEMGALFLALAVIAGAIGGLGINKICEQFVEGAQAVTFGALLVGLAQAVVVIFQNAQVIDTIIHALSSLIIMLPKGVAVLGMYLSQLIINFFVNSGSGQAMLTMPIMIPIADLVGVTRQTAVTAFQFGDGLSNSIYPTSAVLMAVLSVSKIPYSKYIKFFMPLWVLWIILGGIFLLICNAIGYGPF